MILYAYLAGFISWPIVQYVVYPILKDYFFKKWKIEEKKKVKSSRKKTDKEKKK